LPAAEQAQWITHFLQELHAQTDDTSADAGATWIAGRTPSPRDVSVAIDHLRQFRKGKVLGNDLSLRDLIDEGRRV
jgi:hypothetical protein